MFRYIACAILGASIVGSSFASESTVPFLKLQKAKETIINAAKQNWKALHREDRFVDSQSKFLKEELLSNRLDKDIAKCIEMSTRNKLMGKFKEFLEKEGTPMGEGNTFTAESHQKFYDHIGFKFVPGKDEFQWSSNGVLKLSEVATAAKTYLKKKLRIMFGVANTESIEGSISDLIDYNIEDIKNNRADKVFSTRFITIDCNDYH